MFNAFWFGVVGMACILLGFILNMLGKWKTNLRRYIALNCVGSALLAYYAFEISSVPFLVLNAVLAFASAYALATSKRWKK